MQTLKDLKGKKILASKVIELDPTHQYYINLVMENTKPLYYNDSNKVDIIDKKATATKLDLTCFCKDFIYYTFDKMEADKIAAEMDTSKIEYVEKINRYKVQGQNFKHTFSFNLPIYEQVQGLVTFRAGGDYIFDGSYGDTIKAAELTKDSSGCITGFTKKDYHGDKLVYTFIK